MPRWLVFSESHLLFAAESAIDFGALCDIRTWFCAMGRNCYISHLRKAKPSEPIDELSKQDKGL